MSDPRLGLLSRLPGPPTRTPYGERLARRRAVTWQQLHSILHTARLQGRDRLSPAEERAYARLERHLETLHCPRCGA